MASLQRKAEAMALAYKLRTLERQQSEYDAAMSVNYLAEAEQQHKESVEKLAGASQAWEHTCSESLDIQMAELWRHSLLRFSEAEAKACLKLTAAETALELAKSTFHQKTLQEESAKAELICVRKRHRNKQEEARVAAIADLLCYKVSQR